MLKLRTFCSTLGTAHLTASPRRMMSTPTDKAIFAPGGVNGTLQAKQYAAGLLDIPDLNVDPVKQFDAWFKHANSAGVDQPEGAVLSTAELPSGKVSARVVYLKEMDQRGFVIYSNWETSRKSRDVHSNAHAALTFWWHELERQVRVEGPVERLSNQESQVYFDTRIRESRIGAWASRQSQVLKTRDKLDQQVAEVKLKFEDQDHIPVPDFWGGLRIKPDTIEFWQGRPSRLHDRFQYTRDIKGQWKIERLSP